MNLRKIPHKAVKVLGDNSPLVLTALGVAGTGTTAYLSGRAAFTLGRSYQSYVENDNEPPTKKEMFQAAWKDFIPAAATGTMTVTCIIMANRIGTRRAAALAAAYLTSQEVWQEYEAKVKENIGEKKNQEIRDEVARDRANRDARGVTDPIVIASGNKQICHEAFTGRFFECDMETLRKAENDINKQILNSDYATLTNFYSNIGIDSTTSSDDFGWNTDKLLDLSFASILIEDGPYKGQTALSFDFAVVPIRDPWRFC